MTAHELARQLLDGPDLPVHFAYPYGDHWNTLVTPPVEEVRQTSIVYSAYHDMPKIANENAQDQDAFTAAIVLS